jgi:hypothetical protein
VESTSSRSMQSALSALVRARDMSLPDLAKLVRGEMPADPRPNKALDPLVYARLLHGYEHQLLMIQIANHGFRVGWLHDVPRQSTHPKNHRSADAHAAAVVTRILEGVEDDTYLLLDRDILAQWRVHVSPFVWCPKHMMAPSPRSGSFTTYRSRVDRVSTTRLNIGHSWRRAKVSVFMVRKSRHNRSRSVSKLQLKTRLASIVTTSRRCRMKEQVSSQYGIVVQPPSLYL